MAKRKTTNVGPTQILLAFVALLLFVGGIYRVMTAGVKKDPSTITANQIKIEKGDKTVVVNDNGVIEYYTASGVFYDYWDQGRTNNFFEYMRSKAREYLTNKPSEETGGYYITLYVDGKEVKIWVADDDEVVNEVFTEDPGSSTGSGLDEFFEDYFNPSPTSYSSGGSGPTPTDVPPGPGVVSVDDGKTVGGSGGTTQQVPKDCTLFEAAVTGRTVISNALCVDPAKITPTEN